MLEAQGDAPCYDRFCLTVADNGCTPAGCTEYTPGGCTSRTFTVPCSWTYTVAAKVICNDTQGACGDCNACLYIYPTADPTNIILRLHMVDCYVGNCGWGDEVALVDGVSYTISVCLTPCPPHSCDDCITSCTAYGCIWHNIITECCPF